MKHLKYILPICCLVIATMACDSDLDKLVFNEADVVPPVLSGVQDEYVLQEANSDQAIDSVSWTNASFGFSAAVTYMLEIDLAGNSFANRQTLLSSTGNQASATVGQLNAIVMRLDSIYHALDESYIPYEEVPHNIEVRLAASIGEAVAPAYSQVVATVITPYYVEPVTVKAPLYLTGSLLVNIPEWNNDVNAIGAGLQVLFSDDSGSSRIYTYTASFKAGGEGKFPTRAGDWDSAYAYENGSLSPNNAGGNVPGPAVAGYYTMTVNLEDLTVAFAEYTDDVATTYTTIGVVGDATPGGWDADSPLIEVTPHVWVGSAVELSIGALKFRANNAWDINWGYSLGRELPFGIGVQGGDNIEIQQAGTYYLAINDLTGHYIVIPRSDLP